MPLERSDLTERESSLDGREINAMDGGQNGDGLHVGVWLSVSRSHDEKEKDTKAEVREEGMESWRGAVEESRLRERWKRIMRHLLLAMASLPLIKF